MAAWYGYIAASNHDACWYFNASRNYIEILNYTTRPNAALEDCTIFYVDETEVGSNTYFIRQLQGEGLAVVIDQLEVNTLLVCVIYWPPANQFG